MHRRDRAIKRLWGGHGPAPGPLCTSHLLDSVSWTPTRWSLAFSVNWPRVPGGLLPLPGHPGIKGSDVGSWNQETGT